MKKLQQNNLGIAEEDDIQVQTIQTRFVGQCDYLALRWPKAKHRHDNPRGIQVRFVNVPFTAQPGEISITMPDAALEFFRRIRSIDLGLADTSPVELRKLAEAKVDARIEKWSKAKTKRERWEAKMFDGGLWLAPPDAPRHKQLERQLADLRSNQARQRKVLRELRRLEWENSEEGNRVMSDRKIQQRRKRNQRRESAEKARKKKAKMPHGKR